MKIMQNSVLEVSKFDILLEWNKNTFLGFFRVY